MSKATMTAQRRILLVEDNPADVLLTREALKAVHVDARLTVASEGEEALRLLRGAGRFGEAGRPDLILTDLHMPRKGGIELLAELKSDSRLRSIPVIVLTTSKEETEVRLSYDRHANCYLTKPSGLAEYVELFRLIRDFWLTKVELPSC